MTLALSQRDIDELIGQVMRKGGAERTPQVAKARLRAYDFKRPDKFSKDHVRGAQLLFDNFGRQLTSHFSAMFRMALHAEVHSIDQVTYEEFAQSLPDPCAVAIVSWSDLPSNMLTNMGLEVILPMLDRMCGGEGNPSVMSRSLTDIEVAMSRRLAQGMSDILAATVKEFNLQHKLSVVALETNPLFIQQAMAPNDMVLSVSVALKFGNRSGLLEFCLPHALLEPVLPALSANRWFSTGTEQASTESDSVTSALEAVDVPISCRLGSTTLPLKDIMSMEEDDMLELNAPKTGYVTLYVFGKPKFKAKIGLMGNKLAARVVALAEEGEGDPV